MGGVFAVNNPEEITRTNVFVAIYAIMFSAMSVGNNMYYMPDVASAKSSASSIFNVLDDEDEDDLQVKR